MRILLFMLFCMMVQIAREFPNLFVGQIFYRCKKGYFEDFFVDSCRFVIGNEFNTSFWHGNWMDGKCLRELFPEAYFLSNLKYVSVASMGGCSNGRWLWGECGIRTNNSPNSAVVMQRLLQLLGE